ncbi:aldo/keto reductase [Streptomyces sp. 5-6(2022)]|uniref:aldo/keto reductase n=1 Tax=Streptomyces sp. 5-6(2022) TaxID=2936510 RepID=UPI0023B8DEC8|nr:aldo/keto reductase [Streptomyces sp. 5-6(2022)]
MQYRRLGRSGLYVSTLTLGTMTFGGKGFYAAAGTTDVEAAKRQVDIALDHGVNLLDTSNAYSDGAAEEMLGEVLEGRRDRTLIATKARLPVGPGPNDTGASRHHLIAQCEASLRRLRTDHIDLYQMHEWDGLTPLEETLEALDTLVRSGKVRYIGCSNYAGRHLMKALAVSEKHGFQRFISQQIYYSLQAREAEYELVPIALDEEVGILVWSPLAGGLLSGAYRRNQEGPEDGRLLAGWDEPPVRDEDALYDIIDMLVEIGEEHGVSAARVSLAWLMNRPGVASLVVGARKDEQLLDNLAAADLELTAEQTARLDALSDPPLIYPYWHHLKSGSDRLGTADLSLLGGRSYSQK